MSPDEHKKRKLKEKGKVDEEIIKELKAQEKRRKSKLNLKKRRKRDKENGVRLLEDDELSLKDDDTVVEMHNEDFGGERKSLEKKKKKGKLSLKTKRSRDDSNEVDTNLDDQLSLKISDAMVEINHEDSDGVQKNLEKKRKKKKCKLGLKMKRDREKENVVRLVEDNELSHKDDDTVVEMHNEDFGGERKSLEKKKKNKKSKLSLKTKKSRDDSNEVDTNLDDQLSLKINDAMVEINHEDFDGVQKNLEKKRKKKCKLGLKMKRDRENASKVDSNSGDQVSADEGVDDGTMHQKGKKEKKHKKKETNISTERKKEETVGGADKWKVEEIPSVDEDCSRGMKKWLIKYKESRPGLNILQQRIDDYITAYEEQQQQEKKEREAKAAEGGWTVVVHHKGRKKTTDTESGVTVGSVSEAAVVDKMGQKKSKEAPLDFYRFQKREAQRNEVMLLLSKFEQDKKRIQQLRAARKFRPYS